MADTRGDTGLRGFMNSGGLWRLLAFLIVYFAIYLGAGFVFGVLGDHYVDDDLLSSVGSVFFQVAGSLLVGGLVLVAFSSYLGWTHEMFGRQPVYRSWWMWLGPLIVATPILLRVFGLDWGEHGADVVVFVLTTGLLIGFVEELNFRGFAVKMLRDAGHGEWAVAALSSLLFALSHSINLLSGQSITTVGPTIIYTFAFGVLMYLTLRSFRFLVAAMVLHGLTDPTTILATGDLDKATDQAQLDGLLAGAAAATLLLIAAGFMLLIFIRGRVGARDGVKAESAAST